VEASLISIAHAEPLIFGLNCSLGPDEMVPFVEELARVSPYYMSAYPNAGLPDPLSPTGFPETAEIFAPKVAKWAENGWLIVVDSSKWSVIEAGLKCLQGKAVVNSISLKNGEEDFLRQARLIRRYGAATIVMAFDDQGQADSFQRKIEICARAYNLLTKHANFSGSDIIFDPNILTVATGLEEHRHYAVDFIDATRWIKKNLPGVRVSGGVSNISFSFRGNNTVREAMHAAFLFHAIRAGLDMAIVNAGQLAVYEEIDPKLRERVEDVLLNRRDDATERLVDFAENIKAKGKAKVK